MTLGIALSPSKIKEYPEFPTYQSGYTWRETFHRTTLTPTDWPILWNTAVVATGTVTLDTNEAIRVGAATNLTSDVADAWMTNISLRLETISINRAFSPKLPSKYKVTMQFQTNSAANVKAFIGIINNFTGIGALPTTVRHCGIQIDTTASANWFTTSANGTSQVTEDTAVAGSTALLYAVITVNGTDSATIELVDSTGSVLYTDTVTALSHGSQSFTPHIYSETLTTSAKNFDCEIVEINWFD